MKLYYYDQELNFGDELNSWLWERLLPGRWDPSDGIRFAGIGTVLNASMPEATRWIVFTSGIGYGAPPSPRDGRWDVVSVRGPLSAAALGLPADRAISDGALLLGTLPEFRPRSLAERDGVLFVPHHKGDAIGGWGAVCEAAGVEYLSPRQSSRDVIPRLARAKLVLAEAMHAAIIADTLRIPWVPIVTSPQVSTFKWLDWTRSMNVPYQPVRVPPVSTAEWVRQACFRLTGDQNVFASFDDRTALAHLQRQARLKQQGWWPLAQRLGKKVRGRAYGFAKWRPVSALLAGPNERRFARSVAALSMAARSNGFLSEEDAFANRLEALTSRLRAIERM